MNKILGESSSSVIREFIKKASSFWFVYAVLIGLFLIIAFFINKYSKNMYEIQSSILLSTQNKNSAILNSGNMFRDVEFLRDNKNMENELYKFSSFSLVQAALINLNFEVTHYVDQTGLFKKEQELYDDAPFMVEFEKSHVQPLDVKFFVTKLDDSSFRLDVSGEDVYLYNYLDNTVVGKKSFLSFSKICKFNEPVVSNTFKIKVSLDKKNAENIDTTQNKYFFSFYNIDLLTRYYMKRINAEPVSPLGSIITLSFRGENLSKITKFLNRYTELYLEDNLNKKNLTSTNTIKFIDSQISGISDSLTTAETKLREYRSANQVMDLSFQGQRIFDQMKQFETERANLLIQKRYYNYIIDYFNSNKDMSGLVPPSSMNVADPILNQMISELLTLNAERSSIVSNNNQKNLFLVQVENKIRAQKQTIIENVKNNLNTLNFSINELNYRSQRLSDEISKLPRTEIRLLGMERKFKLNDAIYTFLLQKRAEAEIAKAANYPDYEILDPAREITSSLIFPKKKLNYLIALFLGLLFPSTVILIRDFFRDSLTSPEEVELLTGQKVMGSIFKSNHRNDSVVAEKPRSAVAESFRTLRTNMFLHQQGVGTPVILITSSLPREGKSFVAFNLAASIASMGHKTIVVDCDLRRPTLHNKFKIENELGVSTILVKQSTIIETIQETFVPNLYALPAGPILPNPAEYIRANLFDDLFIYLKANFDYIIIDTPPLGAIADSYLLMKYASLNLLVTRQNYTHKGIFVKVINGLQKNKLQNFELVFNGLNFKRAGYGRYYSKYYEDKKSA